MKLNKTLKSGFVKIVSSFLIVLFLMSAGNGLILSVEAKTAAEIWKGQEDLIKKKNAAVEADEALANKVMNGTATKEEQKAHSDALNAIEKLQNTINDNAKVYKAAQDAEKAVAAGGVTDVVDVQGTKAEADKAKAEFEKAKAAAAVAEAEAKKAVEAAKKAEWEDVEVAEEAAEKAEVAKAVAEKAGEAANKALLEYNEAKDKAKEAAAYDKMSNGEKVEYLKDKIAGKDATPEQLQKAVETASKQVDAAAVIATQSKAAAEAAAEAVAEDLEFLDQADPNYKQLKKNLEEKLKKAKEFAAESKKVSEQTLADYQAKKAALESLKKLENRLSEDANRGAVLPSTAFDIEKCRLVSDHVNRNYTVNAGKNIKEAIAARNPVEVLGVGEVSDDDILGCAIKTGDIKLWMIPFYIRFILEFIINLAGLLAVGGLIYGGYLYLFAGLGDQKEKGKEAIKNSIIGLILIMTSWAIVNIVISLVTI